jgi:cation transport ATPase
MLSFLGVRKERKGGFPVSLILVVMGIGVSLAAVYYGGEDGVVLLTAGALMGVVGTISLWVEFAASTDAPVTGQRKWLMGLALVALYFLGCWAVIQNSDQLFFRLTCEVVMLVLLIFLAEVLCGQVKIVWKGDL